MRQHPRGDVEHRHLQAQLDQRERDFHAEETRTEYHHLTAWLSRFPHAVAIDFAPKVEDPLLIRARHVKATRGGARRSDEHPSDLQSLMRTQDAVFCLTKKNK